MLKTMLKKMLFVLGGVGILIMLSGCDTAVLSPKGVIAEQQKDLIFTSVLLMLIVVIPVFILTAFFAWKYRASNKNAEYKPDWAHNTLIEAVCWGIPIVIIVILAVITWRSSHALDPYKPLEGDHLVIEVVALDWKWLFIYPEQNVASVNDLRIPVDKPVKFKISAQAPMNSFWIPHLAGQIYAMEAMQTMLHVKATEIGEYPGLSSNFSGKGYNGMNFITTVSSQDDFDKWVDVLKTSPKRLDNPTYDELAKQTENHPIEHFAWVEENLFLNIMGAYMGMDPVTSKKDHGGHHGHHDNPLDIHKMQEYPKPESEMQEETGHDLHNHNHHNH